MKQLTVKLVRDNICGADSVGKNRDGFIVVRRGFYYRHGMTAELFKNEICKQLSKLGAVYEVNDFGEHYANFRSGAQSSHFWVELKPIDSVEQL